MTLAARLQRRPLLHTLIQTGKPNVPWSVALRNTAAVILPLAIAAMVGHVAAGLAIATGALTTMFADQPGPYRLRSQRMLLTAVAAGSAAFAGSLLGHWNVALTAGVALWGFCAALLVAVGPYATRIGLTSMILLVILGAEPAAPVQALGVAVLIFGGGLLQTVFAIAAWPLQRYRPERLALADALRGLAAAAREPVHHGETVALPPSLNDLQTLVMGEGHARSRAAEAFRVLAELAERMRMELFALADLQAANHTVGFQNTLQESRQAAAAVLESLASALADAAPPRTEVTLARFETAATTLDTHAQVGSMPAWVVSSARARVAALGGQLRAASRNADRAGSRGEIRDQQAELRLPAALRAANPLETLRANLRVSSPAFRHALRCGVCLAIAMALSQQLPLSRGYWLPMTVAIVLRADFGATWRIGLLRVAGTLVGLLLTTALLQFDVIGDFWAALALMAVLCFAFRQLAVVHYGVAVVCLTGLVVILLSFHGIPAETSVHARAIDTVLGSALALLAYFVWPTWERGRERAVLADMLDAYRAYTCAVLHGDTAALRETRVAARAARSAAQASLDRLRNEPASRANLPRAEAMVAQANRLVRAAMSLEAAQSDVQAEPSSPVDAFSRACDAALQDCTRALRASEPAGGDWQLRAHQQALVHSLDPHDGGTGGALVDASDRVVDAIDSIAHILGPGLGPTSATAG